MQVSSRSNKGGRGWPSGGIAVKASGAERE